MKKCIIISMVLIFVFSLSLSARVQVGEVVTEKHETPHPYKAEKGVIWEQTFHRADAGYIALHFSEFTLAKGDYVEILSPDGAYRYVYEKDGKKVKRFKSGKKVRVEEQIGTFWATHIPGNTAIVRLVGKNKDNAYGFVIDKWVHGYSRGYIEAAVTAQEEEHISRTEAVCSGDDKEWAKCYEATEMYNTSRAVCRLLINGNIACTGWLLGSEGHVMTNEHCIESQTEADNTDFEFMAEGANCAADCSSWLACPGTVEASSGTLVRVDYDYDYALVLLPTNVSGTYGYLQLRDTQPEVGERIYVPQHANAWGKQLAVNSDVDGPYAVIHSLDQAPCHGVGFDIGYQADTDGGSSGSPVIGYSDNLVVALHHCGTCPNRGVPVTSIITDLGVDLPLDAVAGGTPPAEYCNGYGKNQNYEWISRVQVGGLDNGSQASAYSDYTARTVSLTGGAGVSVTLTPGYAAGKTYAEYWKIWIDYNDDGDFDDPGEEVFSGSGVSAVTGNFTVSSAASGQTRMRVAMRYGAAPVSCGSFAYGEVEDYTVNIQ